MVEKKAKTWRMCVDYRDLNAACPKDCYPLPRIDQLVDATSGCELLSMMDAYQGYHQVKMHKNYVIKTAFAVYAGNFAYLSMPFGLKNARATYQRMMDKIFKDQLKENVSVYVDDMLVRSAEARTHANDLEEIFSVVRRHKLMLNPAKCTFGVQSRKFLGYKVTPEGIEGAELRYTAAEKTAYAIMITARKLRPYFLSHKVIVRTALPFQQILGRPDLAGRMVKWAIELGEYDVMFEPRTTIKAQALADFIQETTRWPLRGPWTVQVDGSVTKEGCGARIYIESPEDGAYQFAIKFEDKLSNNETEYEAVIRAAHILKELRADTAFIKTDSQLVAQQLRGECEVRDDRMRAYYDQMQQIKKKFEELEIVQVPREENRKADLLAKMASAVEQSWNDEITLLFEPKRGSEVQPEEAEFVVKEIHQGCCGNHAGYKDLTRKIIRAVFY
ncbi:uncharacterized protein LOC130990714 [Salvia miltiorrhiza]|uniref:uncharacterized protein LOC130990714 n=1 Tax=Salvia miltiorrhiza TaxID=226208 RepID=UPI0025AC958D|nr:uncharacterized protein LOC130990714 [Salvia miltiorrhiza]